MLAKFSFLYSKIPHPNKIFSYLSIRTLYEKRMFYQFTIESARFSFFGVFIRSPPPHKIFSCLPIRTPCDNSDQIRSNKVDNYFDYLTSNNSSAQRVCLRERHDSLDSHDDRLAQAGLTSLVQSVTHTIQGEHVAR